MKLLKAIAAILVVHTLTASTCSKNDDTAGTTGNITGNWKVSLYWDNSDETAKFSGYSFEFKSTGQVTATKGVSVVTGTWSETSSKLIIDFGTHPLLSELNDDWLRLEKTTTLIKLKDDNPAQDDKLEFVRN